jgi:hypothetical protein
MTNGKNKIEQSPENPTFVHRLDFYWKFIAIYSVALLVYGLLRGTLRDRTFSISVDDPVVLLMALFILGSAIGMLINVYKARTIIFGQDFIIFKSRFREKTYPLSDIVRISMLKKRIKRIRGQVKVIDIRIKDRKRKIRIRPSSYWNERSLVQSFIRIKKLIENKPPEKQD